MRKGFTLIELLAVIVILAIIALIATPIVLNIINDTKDSANKRNIDMYARALETAIANSYMSSINNVSGDYTTTDGKTLTNTYTNKTIEVDYKGSNVVCEETRIYGDGNYYLNNCKVGNQIVKNYSIGEPIGKGTLADHILNKYGGIDSIGTVNNFNVRTVSGEYGLYKAEDDLGTSYYFRGDVTNNYVQFGTYANDNTITMEYYDYNSDEWGYITLYVKAGDPMYWRIVRINGDGTIRLIYDGPKLTTNNSYKSISIGGSGAYGNDYSYTYLNSNGEITKGLIKQELDSWYRTNIKTSYGKYVSDSMFCNDRELVEVHPDNKYYEEYCSPLDLDDNGERMNTLEKCFFYATNLRIDIWSWDSIDAHPKLTCTRLEDKYTVNSVSGNKLLEEPIGLITADEVIMAGITYYADNGIIETNYLEVMDTPGMFITSNMGGIFATFKNHPYYEEGTYWDPHPWMQGQSSVYSLPHEGGELRPVINLKADVKFKGTGEIGSPYEIIME